MPPQCYLYEFEHVLRPKVIRDLNSDQTEVCGSVHEGISLLATIEIRGRHFNKNILI